MSRLLLSAHWTNLLVVNFETEKSFLEKYRPAGTELATWNNKYILSLVAFDFSKTKLMGIPSPFYRKFTELNLRFYVKRKINNGWRNGVVFIKEIAPHYLVGKIAAWLYHEHFKIIPVNSCITNNIISREISYCLKVNGRANYLKAITHSSPADYSESSLESFIRKLHWAYTRINETKTKEFEVLHRPWAIYPVSNFEINLDTIALYGKEATEYLSQKPVSVFVMDGSETKVTWPVIVND